MRYCSDIKHNSGLTQMTNIDSISHIPQYTFRENIQINYAGEEQYIYFCQQVSIPRGQTSFIESKQYHQFQHNSIKVNSKNTHILVQTVSWRGQFQRRWGNYLVSCPRQLLRYVQFQQYSGDHWQQLQKFGNSGV